MEKAINPQWSNGNIGWDEPPSKGEDLVHFLEKKRSVSRKGVEQEGRRRERMLDSKTGRVSKCE